MSSRSQYNCRENADPKKDRFEHTTNRIPIKIPVEAAPLLLDQIVDRVHHSQEEKTSNQKKGEITQITLTYGPTMTKEI